MCLNSPFSQNFLLKLSQWVALASQQNGVFSILRYGFPQVEIKIHIKHRNKVLSEDEIQYNFLLKTKSHFKNVLMVIGIIYFYQ